MLPPMSETVSDTDARLLTVPELASYGHTAARAVPSGLRSRSPSPSHASASSSRSVSPTLRTPTPVTVSGGPYVRPRSAYASLRPTPSVTSLRSERRARQGRPYHSTDALSKYSSTSSFEINIQSSDTSDDECTPAPDPSIAEPLHITASPKEEVDGSGDAISCMTPISAYTVEDTKYDPPRLAKPPSGDASQTIADIGPVELEFSHHLVPPPGWRRLIAPEGNVYFHNAGRRVLTLADMNDPEQVEWIEDAIQEYERARSSHRLPHDTDVVLDYRSRGYYLVSWEKRCIFWLEKVSADLITRHERNAVSNVHLQCRIRSEFWYIVITLVVWLSRCSHENRRHVTTFPNSYEVTEDSVKEFRAIIIFGYADVMSSETSTFPYDPDTLLHIARLADKLEIGGQWNPYYTSVVARYLLLLNEERFLHYYGERCARLTRGASVFEPGKTSRSYFFHFCSKILFGLPKLYFEELHKVYVDQTIHYHTWRKFITELKNDWQNSITPATVILSANVGFLAIQTIDNTTSYSRSVAQIASYASSLLSLFDYIVVQILMRRHRQHVFDTAARGLQFIAGREDVFGLEVLALTMSLPGGLFIWSMITFLLALEFIFYHHSTIATMVTLSIVGLILVGVILLLFLVNLLGDGDLWQKLRSWWLSKYPKASAEVGEEDETAESLVHRKFSMKMRALFGREGSEGLPTSRGV